MNIEYRPLETVEQLERVVDLEIAVWGLSPRDATPSNMLHALLHSGGCVEGAFDNHEMVGMSVAFPARRNDHWVVWSHMAGVLPSHQGRGIGFDLKQRQRQWALAQGFDEIRWTFDPLQRGNAKFNLCQLGAAANAYHVNFYGLLKDAINGELPTDRLEAVWKLNDPRVIVKSALSLDESQTASGPSVETPNLPALLTADSEWRPVTPSQIDPDVPAYLVPIPRDLKELRRHGSSLPLAWRLALRHVLVNAFEAGYIADDFMADSGQAAYILRKRTL
jgi:predicted GNAT superfamily acetyltransferase